MGRGGTEKVVVKVTSHCIGNVQFLQHFPDTMTPSLMSRQLRAISTPGTIWLSGLSRTDRHLRLLRSQAFLFIVCFTQFQLRCQMLQLVPNEAIREVPKFLKLESVYQ